MKYDDASWHSGGNFPAELPAAAGAIHTGMFVAWAFSSGLVSDTHVTDFPDDLPLLSRRELTPGAYFLQVCDGKFVDEDLTDEGNAFAQAYYDSKEGKFLADYEEILGSGSGLPTLYHVPDTWENFEKIKPRFDQRFTEWRALRK